VTFPRPIVPLVLGALLTMAPLPAAAAPAHSTPGIDVSRWQSTIDWPRVASTDVRYVIMKATQGAHEVDPSYAMNLAGASANGLVVGSYHVAEPGTAKDDAVNEADHFLATARNAPGDILPVLDIEHPTLSVRRLQSWVQDWVTRVNARLGVRPLIYASPYFWRTYMGDSRWFADHGYPLWIAHWHVAAPDVPAAEWGGRSWSHWQYSNTGHVRGITTRVDRDHFAGTDLRSTEIARLSVTNQGGGTVTAPHISCGGGSADCSRLASPGDAVTLSADPGPGAAFVRWSGACASAGTAPTCTLTTRGNKRVTAVFGYPLDVTVQGTGGGQVTSSPSGIACGAACTKVFAYGRQVTLTEKPDSASGFGVWSGACGGSGPACTVRLTAPVHVKARFDAAIALKEDGAGTRFAWARRSEKKAMGGAYLFDRRAGASETFGFTGRTVTLTTMAGPGFGKAAISIDGAQVATFDGYAPALRSGVTHRFASLGPGAHTITIGALGTRSAHASGTGVGVDALRAAGALHANPKPKDTTWGTATSPDAADGVYVLDDVKGATAVLHFTGTGATWVTARGPSMGLAQVWVDGKLVKTMDLYAPTRAFGVQRTVSGLSDHAHAIKIVVLGTHAHASAGTAVVIDGWIVR
jgi:lysozyme